MNWPWIASPAGRKGPTNSHFSALAAVGSVSICDLEVVISRW